MDQIQLTEVNYDCLNTILENLNIHDLLNLVETNKQFVPAAQSVFSRRHRMKTVFVNLGRASNNASDYIELQMDSAAVFCRHFSRLISKLFINFMFQHAIELENAISENFADSLTELRLGFCHHRNFEVVTKPWNKIEVLQITKGKLGLKMSNLSCWFPNLTYLKLFDVCFSMPHSFVAQFHQLKKLVIYNKENSIEPMIIVDMIRLNPQLETLVLQCDINIDLLRTIGESLAQLKELELCVPNDRFSKFDGNPIVFQKVKTFKLKSQFGIGDYICHMPFKFCDLQSIEIIGFNEINFDIHLMNFILCHENIKKIALVPKLQEVNDIRIENLKLLAEMPMLIDMEICVDNLTNDEIISLLLKSKFLNKIQLWYSTNELDYNLIRSQVEIIWNLSRCIVKTSRYLLILERK